MNANIQPAGDPNSSPNPLLFRSFVEAQLIALAVMRSDVARAASRRAWRSELSADALNLLDRITEDPRAAWITLTTLADSEAQWRLADAALSLTLDDLTFHSVGTLISLARGPLHELSGSREAAA